MSCGLSSGTYKSDVYSKAINNLDLTYSVTVETGFNQDVTVSGELKKYDARMNNVIVLAEFEEKILRNQLDNYADCQLMDAVVDGVYEKLFICAAKEKGYRVKDSSYKLASRINTRYACAIL